MTFSAAWQMDAAERRWRSPAAVEAAEEAGAQPTDDKELPGGGSGRKFLWELPESWKRLRLPAMTKNTRRFVLAFGLTLGVVLLIVAAAGIYRWGYNGAIAEKGTYDAGFCRGYGGARHLSGRL